MDYSKELEESGSETTGVQRDVVYTITLDTIEHPGAEETVDIWLEALAFHLEKAKDYQGAEQELGPLAQFVDMSRKWVKIKHALWFGRNLTGPEKVPEILFDLMAHIGLTLRMIRHPKGVWGRDVIGSNYEWPQVPTPGS